MALSSASRSFNTRTSSVANVNLIAKVTNASAKELVFNVLLTAIHLMLNMKTNKLKPFQVKIIIDVRCIKYYHTLVLNKGLTSNRKIVKIC